MERTQIVTNKGSIVSHVYSEKKFGTGRWLGVEKVLATPDRQPEFNPWNPVVRICNPSTSRKR